MSTVVCLGAGGGTVDNDDDGELDTAVVGAAGVEVTAADFMR